MTEMLSKYIQVYISNINLQETPQKSWLFLFPIQLMNET